jgi:hypothetical protein
VESCDEYAGGDPENCEAHLLTFTGLKLTLLSINNKLTAIDAGLFGPGWDLLGDVKVGQDVEVLEKLYGVKIPRDVSPVEIGDQCTPLYIWHANAHVTAASLICNVCD